MHADLMGAAGFQVHDTSVASPKRSITSQCVMASLPAGVRRSGSRRLWRASDRRFDGGAVFFEIALHECVICFDDLMFGELPAHLRTQDRTYAASISPDVPTSSRDTMP